MRFCSFVAECFPDIRCLRPSGLSAALASPPQAKWFATMRNVVVTGGSRGLGLGIARKLAAEGYHVIAVARNETQTLTAAIREADTGNPGSFHFVPFDLAKTDEISAFVKKLRKDFG